MQFNGSSTTHKLNEAHSQREQVDDFYNQLQDEVN